MRARRGVLDGRVTGDDLARDTTRNRAGPRWDHRDTTITIPSGQPSHRFMRYVRPPVKEAETFPQLFPLRAATRQLRLGIDTRTVPTPPEGYLGRSFGCDEIDVQLLVPEGEEAPTAWTDVLHEPLVRQVGFASIEKAGRLLDTVQFWVTTESERERSSTRAHFFEVYQQLDAQTAPPSER
jgi:hypothetical protein